MSKKLQVGIIGLGKFGFSFGKSMIQLKQNVFDLETRVAERTETLERRSQQLQTAADVGSAVATNRDLDSLLNQISQTISERFGFYHVGIFLLDKEKENAVLKAANSEGGQRMLARNHSLRVGEEGIVGHVAGSGQPRIALDVGIDAVHFRNPDDSCNRRADLRRLFDVATGH